MTSLPPGRLPGKSAARLPWRMIFVSGDPSAFDPPERQRNSRGFFPRYSFTLACPAVCWRMSSRIASSAVGSYFASSRTKRPFAPSSE